MTVRANPQVAGLVASQEHRVSQLAARAAAEQERVRMPRWLCFGVSHLAWAFLVGLSRHLHR
jgi:hypothetical protein